MEELKEILAPYALKALGHCPVLPSDGIAGRTLILIGPDEPRFWPLFTQSDEYLDGNPDAMDRWSKRILDAVAQEQGMVAVYPFGGAPFHPFITWALRSGAAWSSPVHLLVHRNAGLFVSYRGALVTEAPIDVSLDKPRPCDDICADQPCKTACPVDAFSDGYDVASCKTFVRSAAGRDCRDHGCRVRRACPIGQGTRLPAQAAFHMDAFL